MRDKTGARPSLIIDLAGVRALAAADLGRLVRLHNLLKAAGASLELINVEEAAHEALKVTRLTDLFVVRPADAAPRRAA